MMKLVVWMLLVALGLEPFAVIAVANSEAEKTVHAYREKAEQEANDDGVREHSDARSYHAEYTDRQGVQHSLDLQREVQSLGADGHFALHDNFHVTIRDIPPPHEARLGTSGSSTDHAAPNESQAQAEASGYDRDFEKLRQFGASMAAVPPEPHKEDGESRRELETEETRLRSAAAEGARISHELNSRTAAAAGKVDRLTSDFTPPLPETLVNLGPDFSAAIPAPYSPHAARDAVKASLALRGQAGAQQLIGAVDEALLFGVVYELQSALESGFTRISSFVAAHREGLQAGAELAVNVAVLGFPVLAVSWNLANLVSMAINKSTLFGTPANSSWDFMFVALGAVIPAADVLRSAKVLDSAVRVGGRVVSFTPAEAVLHFNKHAHKFKALFGRVTYDLADYLVDANRLMKSGRYVEEVNGYVQPIKGAIPAQVEFLGLDATKLRITTFHPKDLADFYERVPRLRGTL